MAPAGQREHELSELPALPVVFDPPPPHPTTPVSGFAISDNDVYNTFPLLESNAIDYFTWAGHFLEEQTSDGFLPSSMDWGGFEPSSSSGFSIPGSLGSDLMEVPLNSDDFVPSRYLLVNDITAYFRTPK